MAIPLYVLLPDGVEWKPMSGTLDQRPVPVRWYLRQSMLLATTQTAVLIPSDEQHEDEDTRISIAEVVEMAHSLGGVVIDARTQQPIDASGAPVAGGGTMNSPFLPPT